MARPVSAGILLYRERDGALEVFIVHPGGPYWAKKDAGVWTIPKGVVEKGSTPIETARREFHEETGFPAPADGELLPLTPLAQPSGKIVHAWAVRGDLDADALESNTFSMEWPPHSGRQQDFPEVDRGAWMQPAEAVKKLLPGQVAFVVELQAKLGLD